MFAYNLAPAQYCSIFVVAWFCIAVTAGFYSSIYFTLLVTNFVFCISTSIISLHESVVQIYETM